MNIPKHTMNYYAVHYIQLKKKLKISECFEIIYKYGKFSKEELIGSSRKRELADSRFLLIKLLYDFNNNHITEIAKTLNRNHATIIHALKSVEQVKELSTEYQKIIDKYSPFLNVTKNKKAAI